MFESLKNRLSEFFSKKEESEEGAEEEKLEEAEEEAKKEEQKKPEEKKKSKKKSQKSKETTSKPKKTKEKKIKEEKLEESEEGAEEEKLEESDKLKDESYVEPLTKFNVGTQKVEPDIEATLEKEEVDEKLDEESKDEPETKTEYLLDKVEKKGFIKRLKDKITTTVISKKEFDELFDELEMLLIENNVALEVIEKIKQDMEKKLVGAEIKKRELYKKIREILKESLSKILIHPFDLIDEIKKSDSKPFIILFFGINGSGKTTTIAKIANMLNENQISSIISASDTFRAASIEQIRKHGEKLNVKVIHQNYGADPSAVAFDAIQHAKSTGIQVVLIDTAGRMHTKDNLLKEMEKIIRITKPNLKIFVAESITGNDATEQAKSFNNAFTIDGTILTKADVDEKGGTAISIGHVTGKPIIYLGTGQEYKNIESFNPNKLIKKIGLE